MKIRRLDIQGFKSFAEKTVLRFGDGITGVVGPNGCGKSNIVDAIRWVMGEQSAKHLRGMGMQDVIFAGCETRGPAGMSEVIITFKNDGNLVPPEYADYDEISVMRRLYRDGTSEYAINKVQCRLRDVYDLFLGTGVGKNAYAIIEQGRIGMIVTSRPEERRSLIEDAAGVSRYKARRKQAERRIEATEQNLTRVRDLVSELGGRLGNLEKQAKKAERYRNIKSELKSLDLHAAAHKYLELDALELFEKRKTDKLRFEIQDEQNEVSEAEKLIAAEIDSITERETAFHQLQAKYQDSQRKLDLTQQNLEFLAKENKRIEETQQETQTEQQVLRIEKSNLEKERSETESVEVHLGEDSGTGDRTREAREIALAAIEEEIATASEHLESEKQSLVSTLTAIAERNNGIQNYQHRQEDLEGRIALSQKKQRDADLRAKDIKKNLNKLEDNLSQNRQLRLNLAEQQAEQEQKLNEYKEALSNLEVKITQDREKLVGAQSRLKYLEQIKNNYEGCTDAVRAIMKKQDQGLHGLIADVLSAEPKYETAVQALLGERLQSVVVTEHHDAFSALRFLQKETNSRSTFVPLSIRLDHAPWAPRLSPSLSSTLPPRDREKEISVPFKEAIAEPSLLPAKNTGENTTALPMPLSEAPHASQILSAPPVASEPPRALDTISHQSDYASEWSEEGDQYWPDMNLPSVCGKMAELVQMRPGYEPIGQALFGDVVVVEDLDTAEHLWTNNGHRKTLVTLTGEILDPMGIFSRGSALEKSEGLLSQKREANELRTTIAHLEAKLEAADIQKVELRTKIEKLEVQIKSILSQEQSGALSLVSQESEAQRLRESIQREQEAAKQAEEEANQLKINLDALKLEQEAASNAIEQLQTEKIRIEARVEQATAVLHDLESQARELTEILTSLKIAAATNRERLDSSHRNMGRIIARLQDVNTRLEKLDANIKKCEEETRSAIMQKESDENLIEVLSAQMEHDKAQISVDQEKLEADKQEVKAREAKVRARREAVDSVRSQLSTSEVKVREHQIAKENLISQIDERYRMNLTEILQEYHSIAPQSPSDLKKTETLRKQLQSIGAINLTAIEEFDEVKFRYETLSGQKNDLEQAIETLRSAIRKINKTSLERYVEAFRLINEKFQQVFPKLFNGGSCSLVMTDERDPLESGIEILAQPPGKKLQSVSLLSGGEKALTATALIFGIFLIKPTPFCLLDEVDAPLDEANVGRYNDLLQEMSSISQFIVITHNKRTMELPDRLYGVTMEVPGISKIVPVDITTSNERKLRAV